MPKDLQPVLRLKVRGPGVRSGRIPVPDLVKICQELQSAVNKQAEAMEGRKTIHPGPAAAAILEECTLDLIAIRKGSATLEFVFSKPQLRIPGMEGQALGIQAISELAASINSLGNGNRKNIDPGVLQSVYALGALVEEKRISNIELIAPGQGKNRRRIVALVNSTVRARAALRLSSPRYTKTHVDGILDMADFKPEEYKCRIDPAIGASVTCKFDPELADQVQHLLRTTVRGTGRAKLAPYTDKTELLELEKLEPLPSLYSGEENFFQDSTLIQLAERQHVKPLRDPKKLVGAIPVDADVDAFLEEIYTARK